MTPTQWLFEQLWDIPKDKLTWYATLKEAEEKFQEEIEDAYIMGVFDIQNKKFDSRGYYKLTYKKNEDNN